MENMMIEMPPELENMMQNLDKMLKSQLSESMGGLRAGLGDLTRRRGKGKASKEKEMTIQEALPQLIAEEAENILDEEKIISKAIENVQNNGIIFLDEIDKLVGENGQTERKQGGYRKGEGVQKELLALTEGCAVNTRHGLVYTDHILFIASGAFHRCVPSDLMPELQGRLPIRVTLDPLGAKEFEKILLEKEYNLIHQTKALLETEGIQIDFTKEAIEEIALISQRVNHQMEDIGARRLATIVSKIIEEISFYAPKMKDLQHDFTIDKSYVQQRLLNVLEKTDLTKYIL
jgi:ATP-dependent HslUV protease ATP-binding subunit HslU